ncbi:hypothetical protein [Catellatospora tritici]|uniref:hypothetical protein n=1 Tax=Catellatospora tritici TaxID=2851566 RepID=UPI001C2DCE24|nr:hypothetical protein [Catellatospora tritici]MBV1855632.1 hypothetical protein [Catellatospora tritici]
MEIDAWIATAERLVAEPFPAHQEGRDGGVSEPGLHIAMLVESQDCWDDDAYDAMEPTLRAFEEMRDRLTEALTARWGSPVFVDLGAALDRALAGEQWGGDTPSNTPTSP